MEAKFSGTIDDKPKYLNPPEPDGIKVEIEYLKDRMLDTTKIPASRLPNTNHADENETAKPKPKWYENGFYWIISGIGAWMLIGLIILLIFK